MGESAKRNLADPALAVATLGMTGEMLMRDLKTFWFIFKALCERDLGIYAERHDGKLMLYRDVDRREIDGVVEAADGR